MPYYSSYCMVRYRSLYIPTLWAYLPAREFYSRHPEWPKEDERSARIIGNLVVFSLVFLGNEINLGYTERADLMMYVKWGFLLPQIYKRNIISEKSFLLSHLMW